MQYVLPRVFDPCDVEPGGLLCDAKCHLYRLPLRAAEAPRSLAQRHMATSSADWIPGLLPRRAMILSFWSFVGEPLAHPCQLVSNDRLGVGMAVGKMAGPHETESSLQRACLNIT